MSSWLASPERRTGTNSSPTSSSILNSAWGMKTVDSVLGERNRRWVVLCKKVFIFQLSHCIKRAVFIVVRLCWNNLIIRFLPSPGSTISTVAVLGNSSTAMTGSDSWISKVSEVSNSWSVKIFTFQVAVVWPGLNWTCFWALPRKSLSFSAVPSTVPIPERDRCEKRFSWWFKRLF